MELLTAKNAHKSALPSNQKILEGAQLLLRAGEFQLAKGALISLLQRGHRDFGVLMTLAKCFDGLGEYTAAIDLLSMLRKKFDFSEIDCLLGELCFKSGEYVKGKDFFLQAEAHCQEQDEWILKSIYKGLGNIATVEKDYDAAEEYFVRAHRLDVHDSQILVNLGTLKIAQNDFDSAQRYMQDALYENIESDKAWVGLGLIHQQKGDFSLAMAAAERALEINKKNQTAIHMFSNLAFQQGKTEKAISRLSEYLYLVQNDLPMSILLIHLLVENGNFDLAYLELEKCLTLDPNNWQLIQIENEIFRLQKGA